MATDDLGAAKMQKQYGLLSQLNDQDIVAKDMYRGHTLHKRVYHLSLSSHYSNPEGLHGADNVVSNPDDCRYTDENADFVRVCVHPHKLGSGGFGDIFKCIVTQKGREDRDICLKLSLQWDEHDKLDREVDRHIMRELENLLLLKDNPHQNITQFLFACLTSGAHSRVCIGLEYFPGGDLAEIVNSYQTEGKRIPSDHINAIFVGIVSAVKHLQQLSIIHCDIKPRNVLFNSSNMKVKLIDFGCAVVFGPTSGTAKTGMMELVAGSRPITSSTAIYIAPEMLDKTKQLHIDSTDVYSIGALMYRLVTFSRPWDGVPEVVAARKYSRHQFCEALMHAMADRICVKSDEINTSKYFTKLQMTLKDSKLDHCQIYPHHCELICDMLHYTPIERPECDTILKFVKENCT